jgi:hypothetical protein
METIMSEHYTIFHQPKNTMPRITSVWAVVSVDPVDGNEGVAAAEVAGIMMPLIAADEKRLEVIVPIAKAIKAGTGLRLKLVKFTTREEVEEI